MFKFSAPSDPFQKKFLHIHRVTVIVDLIIKICCRMYKTMCTYCELPPSFPTLPVQQTHEVIVVKKKFLSLLHWKSRKKGGSSQYCFVHLTRCLSTSGGPGKHRFGSANDAVPGNHLPCRNHTYRYVDTRKIPLENNPDDRYCTRYLSRGKQSKQNPKKMWQIEKWNISKMFTYVGNACLKNTLLSSVTFVSFVLF